MQRIANALYNNYIQIQKKREFKNQKLVYQLVKIVYQVLWKGIFKLNNVLERNNFMSVKLIMSKKWLS